MTSPGPLRPASRYGSAQHPEKRGLGLGSKAIVLVFAAMFVVLVFYSVQYFQSREKVNASLSYVTHDITSDSSIRVWVDVTRNHLDQDAYCIVQAFDYSKAEVGRREFPVPTGGEEAMRVAVDIPTSARAVAGGAYGCSGAVPAYLDMNNPQYAESS
ncbi:DUF4307 domain-containing protein [Corynebacterium flavescens]|uniref:DUF4307 domain-containing protein n=1 Tax=Corynebacterium flavescens TaxID=28028 RepID=UPI003FCFFBB0